MPTQRDVFTDLNAEAAEIDRLLAGLDTAQWELPTPAPGWTIAHQVAHLAATFRLAGLAAANPAMFQRVASTFSPDFDANVSAALAEYLAEPPATLFQRWQAERDRAASALAAVPPNQTVPWLVNPLPPTVLASAGMMELFGHGQDIADTLGVRRTWTDGIDHLVAFAVRTWDFGYLARDMAVPDTRLRFEITAPSGASWEFGPADADNRIAGPAEDLCLLVTRRRHHTDLDLVATGDVAQQWLEIAQAYRGPAGQGRTAGQFATARR